MRRFQLAFVEFYFFLRFFYVFFDPNSNTFFSDALEILRIDVHEANNFITSVPVFAVPDKKIKEARIIDYDEDDVCDYHNGDTEQ